MATSLNLIRDIRRRWRQPSEVELPTSTVFMVLQEAATLLAQGLVQSNQGQADVAVPLRPVRQDQVVPAESFSLPDVVRARPLGSAATDPWSPVQIVNLKAYDGFYARGEDAVCFWGTPPRMRFTLDTLNREYELIYPLPLAVPQNTSQSPQFDAVWHTYLKMEASVQVGPLIEKKFADAAARQEWAEFVRGNTAVIASVRDQWKRMWDIYRERGNSETSYKVGFDELSSYGDGWPDFNRCP